MGGLLMSALLVTFAPAEVERHLAGPATQAAPLFAEVAGAGHWVGVSWRGGSERDFGAGSVAFYYNGPEDRPRTDFAAMVRDGREAELGASLLELRWRDPGTGALVRRVDLGLLGRLGFAESDLERLSPPPQAAGSLYF